MSIEQLVPGVHCLYYNVALEEHEHVNITTSPWGALFVL